MQCGVARKHLYLSRDSRAEGVAFPIRHEAAQAEDHLSHCEACQEFLASEQQLTELLRMRAPRQKVPAALRERIFSQIARERKQGTAGSRRFLGLLRSRRALALASVLVLAVAGGSLWLAYHQKSAGAQELASVLIDDHARSVPGATEIASADRDMVLAWFDGRLDFRFHLPATSEPSLIGGRLCNVQGRRAALILYRHHRSPVSLFIFDGSNFDIPEDRLIAVDGRRCFIDANRGYNLVMWSDRNLIYGLVSDVRSADLLQLAAQF
ncbi:MAG TPA: hypothetical protein VJH03_27095 [Blastocatellia bacterium]|nr:hypothetical protein [Blastocatellia bacterium]